MDFKQLTLADKSLFNSYLAGREYQLITYNYSNFYLWRNWDPYSWALVDDALVVKSNYLGRNTICVPISSDDDKVVAATKTMIKIYQEAGQRFTISEVDDAALILYQRYFAGSFTVEPYPDGFNYLYNQADLALLPGKKYAAKRNHINRFKRTYPNYRFLPLTEQLIPLCQEQLELWVSHQEAGDEEIIAEHQGCIDALSHFDQLDVDGAALLVDGRVVAFTIGEPLNKDTYCIHIEKADIDIHGAYQAINSFFAKQYSQGFKYINRAEDMGDAGLKRAKASYYPCKLQYKYYLNFQ